MTWVVAVWDWVTNVLTFHTFTDEAAALTFARTHEVQHYYRAA